MAKPRVYIQDALCPKRGSDWAKKDTHSRGKRQYKRYRRGRKHQKGAKHRHIDERKEKAVKMRAEGMSLSATAHLAGVGGRHSEQVGPKKEVLAAERLKMFKVGVRGELECSRLLERLPGI